jgi:hypothetical protein
MKRNVLLSALVLITGPLLAADSGNTVKDAARKLAEKGNYSWKTTIEAAGGGGGGGRFRPGPTEGKTEKDGYTLLSMTRGDNTIEAVLKGSKGAIKTANDGWKSLVDATADAGGGQPNPARFIGRMLQNFKAPAAQAEDLADRAKELKSAEGAYSGDLTEEGAKSLLTFGRGRGGNGPEISGAKGSVKFWIKDGVLSKIQLNVQGKVSFNGNDRDVDRTTTIEIKDVGTTTVTVPDDAKKVLS